MALALQDAGFESVVVDVDWIILDEVEYEVDSVLVKWQENALQGQSTPMVMKLDRERLSVGFVEEQ